MRVKKSISFTPGLRKGITETGEKKRGVKEEAAKKLLGGKGNSRTVP